MGHIISLCIYHAVDHGIPAGGDIWIVMYEIIRGKPAHSSFQQNSRHTSSDVAAIPTPSRRRRKKRTICLKSTVMHTDFEAIRSSNVWLIYMIHRLTRYILINYNSSYRLCNLLQFLLPGSWTCIVIRCIVSHHVLYCVLLFIVHILTSTVSHCCLCFFRLDLRNQKSL